MMIWRLASNGLLHISNTELELRAVRALISGGCVPTNIHALVYRTPELTYLICGYVLREWIAGRVPDSPRSRAVHPTEDVASIGAIS